MSPWRHASSPLSLRGETTPARQPCYRLSHTHWTRSVSRTRRVLTTSSQSLVWPSRRSRLGGGCYPLACAPAPAVPPSICAPATADCPPQPKRPQCVRSVPLRVPHRHSSRAARRRAAHAESFCRRFKPNAAPPPPARPPCLRGRRLRGGARRRCGAHARRCRLGLTGRLTPTLCFYYTCVFSTLLVCVCVCALACEAFFCPC